MASAITEKIKQNELKKFINGRDVLAEDFNLNFEIIREAINDHDKAVMTIEKFKGLLTTEPAPSASEEHDWYINISQNIMRIFEGKVTDANGIVIPGKEGSWRDIGAKQVLQVFDTVAAFEAGTQEKELALLKVKIDPKDPASKEELFVAVKHKKDDGTFEVIEYATKDYIDRKIIGSGTSMEQVLNEAELNMSGIQKEIEFMNDGGKTELGEKGFELKEKQDKLRDDQFIETAEVDFLEISAISSAAGIAADLSGVKADISSLKAKDTATDSTIQNINYKVSNLDKQPAVSAIKTIADANAAAIAGLATNTAITTIDNKAKANDAAIKALQSKEQNDVNQLNTALTTAQTAIDTKIAGKADKTVTDALGVRVTKNEADITKLKTDTNTQASTVTTHTTKIGTLETTTATHTGQIQGLTANVGAHTVTIQKHTNEIKEIKSLVSFVGIYAPASLPVSGGDVKAKFGEAKIGMFSFVKASTTGDLYQIWTAETNLVGGNPVATGDWVHEVGADIAIQMTPYLLMEMFADGSGQKGPTEKGQVIYNDDITGTGVNKWTNLTTVLKDAYNAQLITANKGKLMTIVNTGTDAAPVWDLAFAEPALLGTDLLMETTGGWSAGYTPQIGDVVVVNEADADGKITKLGATVAKAMFGESEEKTPGSGVWTAKTDTKDKMALGGDNTTKLQYVDNPDFTTLGTDKRPRIWTFKNGDTKGGWQPLDEAEINGKSNFTATDVAKLLVVKAVDATTGNVELEPIDMKLSDFTDLKTKVDGTDGRFDSLELRMQEAEDDIVDLKNTADDVTELKDTKVPALETFKGYFDVATDGGYVFKTDDTNYETQDVKTIGAALVTDTNFGTTAAEKEAVLMTSKQIKDAIKDSLEPRQKELINFQQQKTKPDGTPEFEADGVTPVMIDLADSKKPVKFTGEKDTALTQATTMATQAAGGVVVTTGSDLTVAQMLGKDADAADGTPGPNNDDKKLMSKKAIEAEIAITDKSTLAGEALWNALEADKFYIIKTKTSTTADAISNEKVIIEVHSKDTTAGIKFTAIALDNTFHSTAELTFAKPAAGDTTELPEVISKAIGGAATVTIIKNKGKVSDYMPAITSADMANRNVKLWHEIPGIKKWAKQMLSKIIYRIALSSTAKYMLAGSTSGELFTSNDYGVTWTKIITFQSYATIYSVCMSDNGKYMYAGYKANRDSSITKIYRSDDYGANWTSINTREGTPRACSTSASGQYVMFSRGPQIIVSNDYGANWTERHSVANEVSWSAMSDSGQYMAYPEYTVGINVSNDYGVTWKTTASFAEPSREISMSTDGKYILVGSDNKNVYVSSDYGATWTTPNTISQPYTAVDMSDDGKHMVAGAADSKVYISNDYGVTWRPVITKVGGINTVSISGDGKTVFGSNGWEGATAKSFVSNDYGATWTIITDALFNRRPMEASVISKDGSYIVSGDDSVGEIFVSSSTPTKHHHALVIEVDDKEDGVYCTEKGKIVNIGDLQLNDKYHLEIEADAGTTIADGTSTDGVAAPVVVV